MNAAYLLRVLTVTLLMLFSTGMRASDVPVAESANGVGFILAVIVGLRGIAEAFGMSYAVTDCPTA